MPWDDVEYAEMADPWAQEAAQSEQMCCLGGKSITNCYDGRANESIGHSISSYLDRCALFSDTLFVLQNDIKSLSIGIEVRF